MSLKSLATKIARSGPALMILLLVAVLLGLLGGGCLPGHTLFSNDAPLGRLMSACHRLPERFTGCWQDLNSIGYREGAAVPNLTYGLEWLLGPLGLSKLYAPLALLFLGLSAWGCFRQFGLVQPACVLGGVAAALNSAFFSAACWGVAAHAITVGLSSLALAALADSTARQRWPRAALSGLALGMAVTEGADIGALFSMVVAGFVVWQAWLAEGPRAKNLAVGVLRLALVALCAAALAASTISELLATNVKGVVAAAEQDTLTQEGHWDWATQWSLPKRETLGLIVPGLFGYRLDTPDGGAYWGTTGQDPAWERYLAGDRQGPRPSGVMRFVGGGNYAGVPVALLAIWTAAQCCRRKHSVFALGQRRLLWFWLGVAVTSLLLAFGRYAPFYQWVYALPHFSSMRNPVKFIHVFSFAIILLFAFGFDSLWRKSMRPNGIKDGGYWGGFKSWWAKAAGFERRWAQGCLVILGLSLLAWVFYNDARPSLEQYLRSVEFDRNNAPAIADFSIRQVGWFVLFFSLAAGVVALILSGAFAGTRAVWGAVGLGLVLAVDLGRANRPWIRVWDYEKKYASNPIVDRLREKPYEHRVADMPREFLEPELQRAFSQPDQDAQTDFLLHQIYSIEWAQHLFYYYNVQSLNITQLPRKPADLKAFEDALKPHAEADFSRLLLRRWQLTNTRYLLGTLHFLEFYDRLLDPGQHRLRVVERFNFAFRPGAVPPLTTADFQAVPAPDGPFALLEFTGALPRARLYSRWQVATNDQAALSQLVSASFDPEQSVLVGGESPAATLPPGVNPDAGTVEFASYAPKHLVLQANAAVPSVLLLNDRFDPYWNVRVDGQPAKALRCNFIMRGVYLAPGVHRIEFHFQPPIPTLYVSLVALGFGLLLLSFVTVSACRNRAGDPPLAGASRPRTLREQENQVTVLEGAANTLRSSQSRRAAL